MKTQPLLSSALLVAGLSLGWLSTAQAAPEKYLIDNSHTYPYFEITHLGWSTTRGLFSKTSGTVTVDFAAKTGSAEILIDAASLDTSFEKRDRHVRSEDFLDVEKYPTISFKSDKFDFDGEKVAKVHGQLSLHGVTKPVTLTMSQFKCGEHPMAKKPYCAGDAATTLKRSDFGMTGYQGAVGDEVKLFISIEAAREG